MPDTLTYMVISVEHSRDAFLVIPSLPNTESRGAIKRDLVESMFHIPEDTGAYEVTYILDDAGMYVVRRRRGSIGIYIEDDSGKCLSTCFLPESWIDSRVSRRMRMVAWTR